MSSHIDFINTVQHWEGKEPPIESNPLSASSRAQESRVACRLTVETLQKSYRQCNGNNCENYPS
jgi:hypothetical protein